MKQGGCGRGMEESELGSILRMVIRSPPWVWNLSKQLTDRLQAICIVPIAPDQWGLPAVTRALCDF